MPVGLVCQLRYDGGGALLYRASEDSVVPFYTASCRLLIGQKVTFSLHQSVGRAEAVDVACVETCSSTLESKPQPPKHFLQEPQLFRVVSSDSTAQLPLSRKLQRSVFRFHNATREERLVMLGRAEERLETAMSSSPLDGAQLCRLVNRCAGWLHAVSLDRRTSGQTGEGRDSGMADAACNGGSGNCWSERWNSWIWQMPRLFNCLRHLWPTFGTYCPRCTWTNWEPLCQGRESNGISCSVCWGPHNWNNPKGHWAMARLKLKHWQIHFLMVKVTGAQALECIIHKNASEGYHQSLNPRGCCCNALHVARWSTVLGVGGTRWMERFTSWSLTMAMLPVPKRWVGDVCGKSWVRWRPRRTTLPTWCFANTSVAKGSAKTVEDGKCASTTGKKPIVGSARSSLAKDWPKGSKR